MTDLTPRAAVVADFAPLTDLWDHLWHLAHDHCTPPGLVALRTHADFRRRLAGFGDGLRVIGPSGAPQGFAAIAGNHLDQLYVAQTLWGTGAARALTTDALARIAAAGHDTAVLECNTGNARAAAFYRKSGWRECGVQTAMLDTSLGPYPLDCFIFVRDLV
jgi:GNAT superfamily N-acetyltransferase